MNFRNAAPAAAALAAVFLAACYSQAPLEVAVPTPETRLVAQVTDSGAASLSNAIGPGAMEIEGIVTEADNAQWKLQLLRVDTRFGASNLWRREVVAFPRSALTRPRVKRFDRTKSWLAGGGIAVAAIVAARLFSGLAADEGPDGTPNPQVTLKVPGGIGR
jgi:hypothetical protein